MVDTAPATSDPLLRAMRNMAVFHREHEKYYSVAPREQAVVLQRHSRTLHALADTWAETDPSHEPHLSPYEGATDLNAAAALQLDGVLFMAGDEPPGEIAHLIRDLRALGEDDLAAGAWLEEAMRTSWEVVATLLDIPGLADLVGERHRIIANNWQAAAVIVLAGRILGRAADVLERIDFRPDSVRADLGEARASVGLLASAAELIDRAADLHSEFATLVHDNERRWRVFHARVSQLIRD